jgi:hypothetical protein
MAETRKAERVRSLLRAHVIYNNNNSTIDCVVKNFSPYGVRLEIPDNTALPAAFDLSIPHKARTFRGRIVWRTDGVVGVEFLDPQTTKPVEIGTEGELDRNDVLMRENAKLKAQILKLRQRVSELSGGE